MEVFKAIRHALSVHVSDLPEGRNAREAAQAASGSLAVHRIALTRHGRRTDRFSWENRTIRCFFVFSAPNPWNGGYQWLVAARWIMAVGRPRPECPATSDDVSKPSMQPAAPHPYCRLCVCVG
eukprot:1349708-Amorphochlora_amoeboformis.AAC.1